MPDSGYPTYKLSAPVDSALDAFALANALQKDPNVEWATPDFVTDFRLGSVPSDPYFPLQYYLKNTLFYNGVRADINVEPAWDLTKGSSSIRITFIDSGIDAWHPELAGRPMTGFDALWYVRDPQDGEWAGHPHVGERVDSHGTAVTGIAVAAHNGVGIAGVAPNVLYDAVRIFRGTQVAASGDIANGIRWAYQRSDVLNNSWYCGAPHQGIADAIRDALRYGRNGLGSVVVFIVGNYNPAIGCTTQTWQSQIPGVIAVAALARNGSHASYSVTGPSISVSAFGGELVPGACYGADIVTLDLSYPHTPCNDGPNGDNRYTTSFGGTSAAAPQVSGVAALLLSREPYLRASDVKQRIMNAADPWGDPTLFGAGKLNAYRTLTGVSVTVDGPTYISFPGTYSWSAIITGGNGTYTYDWEWRWDEGSWEHVGTDPTLSSYVYGSGYTYFYVRVTVTSAGQSTTSAPFLVRMFFPNCDEVGAMQSPSYICGD